MSSMIVSTDSNSSGSTVSGSEVIPSADIYESADSLVILADMPGVSENSVEIVLDRNTLSISGRMQLPAAEKLKLLHCEYKEICFKRDFRLGNYFDHDSIVATMKNGLLKLVLPKNRSSISGPRKIQVSAL